MQYGYKPTTTGRSIIAACMAQEAPLRLTRVAVGNGRVGEDVNLADVHALVSYVADAEIAERRHEENRLFLTVQYANGAHPEVDTFYLSEFMVFAEDPETGEEKDLLYATLGDYIQPVPQYSTKMPQSVYNYQLVLVVSDQVEVEVTASPGLVTHEDLEPYAKTTEVKEWIRNAITEFEEQGGAYSGILNLTIPQEGWTEDDTYGYVCDVEAAGVRANHWPCGGPTKEGEQTAQDAGMYGGCETMDGYVRFYAKRIPAGDIPVTLAIFSKGSGGGSIAGIATETTPGAVMPGDGMTVAEDGTLSLSLGSGLTYDENGNLAIDTVDETEVKDDVVRILNSEDEN